MCNCLDEVEKEIRTHTKDPEANIAFSVVGLFSGKNPREVPYMSYEYRRQKKDGSFYEGKSTATIIPTFCPFCGVKYEA